MPAVPRPRRRIGGALAVGAGIFLSRIAGLVRERALAHYLGLSTAADAFRAALRIPNFLQNLLGEGVLSASFIPVYARLLAEGKTEEASRVARAVGTLLALVAALLALLGVVAAPWLVYLFAPGFHGEARELTIALVRILFPGVAILVLSAWCLGVLNSHRKFFLSYVSPVLWNTALIAAAIVAGRRLTGHDDQQAIWLAWGAVIGSAAQCLVQVPTVIVLLRGLRPSLAVRDPGVRATVRAFLPVLIGRGSVQISGIIDSAIASSIGKGIVAAMANAQTLYLLPVSLFGMAVSAAELPEMSSATDDAIAAFYGDMRLVPVVRVAAVGIVLGAFASPPQALLRRQLAFGVLAAINTAGLAANLIASIVFIHLGAGYLSLAFASFISLATITAASVLYRPKFWIFRPSLRHWRAVFGFGGIASATAVLNNFYQVLPQALLGRLAGFDAAGLYSRAVTLCQLPDRAVVGAFQPVIFPAFAAEVRAGSNLRAAYLHALTLLAAVQWPVLVCLAILAEPVVAIILGPQWHAAAPILRILAIAYLGMTPAPLTYPTLVALGRVQDTLTASLITLPIGIAGIVVAAPFGLMAVAASMLLSWPLQVLVSLVFIRRQLHFGWHELVMALAQSLPACIGASLVPLLVAVRYGFAPDLPIEAIALALIGAACGWLLGLFFSRNPLFAELQQLLVLARARFGRRRAVTN